MSTMPDVDHRLLDAGRQSRKRSASRRVQKPMTGSTPARLYQLRSKMHDLAGRGKVRHVALHVHLRLLASVGAGSATTRNTRGLTAR